MARRYVKLKVWRAGIELVRETYRKTRNLPDSERFGLISQMRRAAVSIPANIAEGYGRGSDAELRRFLLIARGSLFELETLLIIAELEEYLHGDSLRQHTEKVFAMLTSLLSAVAKTESMKASGVKRPASSV